MNGYYTMQKYIKLFEMAVALYTFKQTGIDILSILEQRYWDVLCADV